MRFAFTLALALAYYPPLMVATNGQTLGTRLLGIRVARTDGEPMSWRRAAWREVVVKLALFDALVLVPGVGRTVSSVAGLADVLWPLGDAENRALHDMLAGTRVRMAAGSVEP